MRNEVIQYHMQAPKLALRNLVSEAMRLTETTDFNDHQQVNLLRDRLSRALGCVGSLQTLANMQQYAKD